MRQTVTAKQPIMPFWLLGWAVVLAVAWLLPNHYPPWSSFHADAWIAVVLALTCRAVIVRSSASTQWHGPAVLVAILVCVPWLQYSAGLISFAGLAWIFTAYFLGRLLALLTGTGWGNPAPTSWPVACFGRSASRLWRLLTCSFRLGWVWWMRASLICGTWAWWVGAPIPISASPINVRHFCSGACWTLGGLTSIRRSDRQ